MKEENKMPWTEKDVDKHNKGLGEKQKKEWVAIANSVLSQCVKKGGDDATCTPKAIRIANSKVKANMETYSSNFDAYTVEEKEYQGRNYRVVPVVMMREGVHNGSLGPLLHTSEELAKFPESWNGIPIMNYHPKDSEGRYISANSPEVIEESSVGIVFNTQFEEDKLKAEAWFDIEKTKAVSEVLYNALSNKEPIDVSIGTFSDYDTSKGTWHDEQYTAISRNYRPDHLAILPGQKGACSIEDGCGLGVNSRSDDNKVVTNAIEILIDGNYTVGKVLNNLTAGLQEQLNVLYSMVRSLRTEGSEEWFYLVEAYDTYLIYEKSVKDSSSYFKQGYHFKEDGTAEFDGEPEKVIRKVEYTTINVNKEEKPMSGKCPACDNKITALINNSETKWTEEDRPILETMTEAQLDKLNPVVVEKTVEVNALTPEDRAALNFGKKELKARRDAMVQTIQNNTPKDTWTGEILNNMDEETLTRVFNSVKREQDEIVTDYSLGNVRTRVAVNAGTEEALLPNGVN